MVSYMTNQDIYPAKRSPLSHKILVPDSVWNRKVKVSFMKDETYDDKTVSVRV